MPTEGEYIELKKLLKKQEELLEENNRLLRRMHRNAVIGFWMRILWYALVIGVPLVLYYYFLKPYLNTINTDYQQIMQQMQTLSSPQFLQQMINNVLPVGTTVPH